MARPVQHPHRTAPLLLCVECSTMYCSVAIVSTSGCIAEHSLISRVTHSKRLLTAIADLMRQCELDWQDLHGLAISIGPGSFTGLRIGLTTLKGICMATGLPLMGLSSLKALACQLPFCRVPICPIFDARKQEVYTALYQAESDSITTIMGPVVIGMEKLTTLIHKPTLFVGDGVEVYGEILRTKLVGKVLLAPPQQVFPKASAIGTLALKKFVAKSFVDPGAISPLYIRPSDAETNLLKAKHRMQTT